MIGCFDRPFLLAGACVRCVKNLTQCFCLRNFLAFIFLRTFYFACIFFSYARPCVRCVRLNGNRALVVSSNCLCSVAVSARLVVVPSLLLVWRPGTRFLYDLGDQVKVNVDLYSASYLTSKAFRCVWITQFYLQTHHTCLYRVVRQRAPRLNEPPADEAYYSLIDPVRMRGWVGLDQTQSTARLQILCFVENCLLTN